LDVVGDAGVAVVGAEVVLDPVAFVADNEMEVSDAGVDEGVKDVFKNRAVARWEHWLGTVLGERSEAEALSGGEDDGGCEVHIERHRPSLIK
jgi:hypothetical protein